MNLTLDVISILATPVAHTLTWIECPMFFMVFNMLTQHPLRSFRITQGVGGTLSAPHTKLPYITPSMAMVSLPMHVPHSLLN